MADTIEPRLGGALRRSWVAPRDHTNRNAPRTTIETAFDRLVFYAGVAETLRKPAPFSSPVKQVGLDAAGKTTILYKLKLGEIVTTIPTIGK